MRIRTEAVRRYWPLIFLGGWLIFAASTRVIGLLMAPGGCYDYERGVYWLFVLYKWPALIATLLTLPLCIWIASGLGPRWYDQRGALVPPAVLIIAAQIAACSSCIYWFEPGIPSHRDIVRASNRIYYLAECWPEIDHGLWYLYECDTMGLWCERVVETWDYPTGGLRVDPSGNVIEIEGTDISYPLD